jgi:hypothetical protein
MSETAQKRALQSYRSRLTERGTARFEVMGLFTDRELIRSLAKHLSEEGAAADRLRASVRQTVTGKRPATGGILMALRGSPLVGADLDISPR